MDLADQLRAFEPGPDYPDPEGRREDLVFGRLLLSHRVASMQQILECLDLQNRSVELGIVPPPRLGELLVAHGYLPAQALSLSEAPPTESGELPVPEEAAEAAREKRNHCGKFVRTRLLGRGGMGEVWKAWDTSLRRWVALKFVQDRDALRLEQFRREAQIAARLVHPAIATIYDIVEDGNNLYLVLQLIEGETLDEAIRRRRHGFRALARILRDAAFAVDFAHEHGVIHRDLKPSNLMILADTLRVYVLDFGLARHVALETETSEGVTVGTPQYMPPEQALGDLSAVGARSDVYSLGASLYHALTGTLPFDGPNRVDVLHRVLRGKFKRPSESVPDLPRDLETIVLKAMDYEPRRRYAKASLLAADLQRFLDGEPLQARPMTRIERLRRRVRPRTGLMILGAIAVLLAGGWLVREKIEKTNRQAEAARAREELRRRSAPEVEKAREYVDQAERLIYGAEDAATEARALAGKAAGILDDVVRDDPQSEAAWLELGRAHAVLHTKGSDHDSRAEECFRRALPLDRARFELGRVYLHRYEDLQDIFQLTVSGGRTRREPRPSDPEAARGWKSKAKEEFALTTRAGARGFSLVLDEQYREAEAEFDRAIAAFELDAEALEYRSYCRFDRSDAAGARDDLSRVLKLRPRWPRAFRLRALAHLVLENLPASIADYTEAIALDPHNPRYLVERSIVYRHAREWQKAADDLEKAVSLDEKSPEAWMAKGNLFYTTQRFEDAETAYARAIELRAGAPAYMGRGAVRAARDDWAGAHEDLTRAIELNGASALARMNRGIIRVELRNLEGAREDWDEALRIDADLAEAYYWRGMTFGVRRDLEEFIARAPHHRLAESARTRLSE